MVTMACGGNSGGGADPVATSYRDTLTSSGTSDAGFSDRWDRYGVLSTLAGTCRIDDKGVNGWQAAFEGGPAIDAELSRPHFAMADDAGNIFVADKDAHGIRRIATDGTIATVAGTNAAGDDGDGPGPGTEMRLSSPNGLWVRGDGTVYILDLGNSKVRRLTPSNEMSTLFTSPDPISLGRGLWVSDDETLVYFSSGSRVRRWTPEGGVETVADGFLGLGNLTVDPDGYLVVTDRVGNRVYRINDDNAPVPIAGNGTASGGGSGMPALDTGLEGVRGVWFLEDGSYFLATHEGNQVWMVDTSGLIYRFLDGAGDAHAGDGEPFDTPGAKISEARSVSVDSRGNVIITEHDCGYIRVVAFVGESG